MEYMDALIKLYGEGIIEELRENDKQIKPYKIFELEALMVYYKQRIKELEEK